MRRDDHLAELGDDVGAVLAAIRSQGQPPGRSGRMAVEHVDGSTAFDVPASLREVCLHDQPGSVFHQTMPYEAEHRACAGRFLEHPGAGIACRHMGGIRAPFATEVDFGVAAAVFGAGREVGLGYVLLRSECW